MNAARGKGEGELQLPNELFLEIAATEMKETAFILSPDDREVVENTITRHCEIRSWTMHSVNAQSNHVHVVVAAPGYDPEIVRDQFKAWCTRHHKPSNPGRDQFWTEGASRRSINHEGDLESTIIDHLR